MGGFYRTGGCGLMVALLALQSEAGGKEITAVRVDRPPVIDGRLTEDLWQQAGAVLDFTQFDPVEGALPSELTSVRILYTDRALYVGVICYDSRPQGIVRQLTRRDRSTEADRFTVMIDSFRDRQSAFVFSANVSGVQSDGILSQAGMVYEDTWDAVWSVQTRVYRDGWSAEFEIPFHELRFAAEEAGELDWGVNFRRYISRKHEITEWVMVPRSEQLQIPFWGTLRGVRGIHPPLHLTVVPYVSGSAEALQQGFEESPSWRAQAGLDLKYGITNNFTLDATVNPDFGQVEVDRAVLNLTVFETLFPERRPFFVEGSQFFSFGASVDNSPLPLFFSRRIGKQPTGASSVVAPAGGAVVSNPQQTTILGALKLSGRSSGGTALGVVSALTDREVATVRDSTGARQTIRTEPRGSYSVARVRQDFSDGSWIGMIGTLAARESTVPALAGGLDWNLRLGSGTHSLDGYLAAARPSLETMPRVGVSGRLLFSRVSAEHWFYAASYDAASRTFDINDLGYFARPRDQGGYMQVLYRQNSAAGPFLRYGFSLVPEARWNWDGIATHRETGLRSSAEFRNFWLLDLNYTYRHPAYDDAESGIVGTYRRPAGHTAYLGLASDPRAWLAGELTLVATPDVRGKSAYQAFLGATIRPAAWVELMPWVGYQRVRFEETGVFAGGGILTTELGGQRYSVFGDRDLDEVDLSFRGIITFTRSLSLQFTTQVLMARGTYRNYRRLVDATTFAPEAIPEGQYDFNTTTFNANVLLRWEYLPGSTAYLVWTQERYGDSAVYDTGFAARFKDTFALPHDDVVLLKVSYWLSF